MGAKLDKNSENTKDSVLNLVEKLRKRNKLKWFGYHLANLLYYQNPQSGIRKSCISFDSYIKPQLYEEF